ncbi:MAG: 30S ribosomal protein S3 [Planctomycetes bacterium RBG_16_59_8]|nr:MAG: 30S ribosomal protein S3 [Planctomycetes bacterium RBG_16_59_8]
MGQKVNPISFRLGITENWRSRWYATKKDFGRWLIEDWKIRDFVKSKFAAAGIARVDIERIGAHVKVIVSVARPALVIGKRGANIDALTSDLSMIARVPVILDIKEVDNPETNAQVVSQAIAEQLEKRAPFKRTIRKYAEMIRDLGAEGVKIQVKGRLGGAEIARSEFISMGRLPLHTIRAKIDYGATTATLTKGTIGVKVWICKGEELPVKGVKAHANAQAGKV